MPNSNTTPAVEGIDENDGAREELVGDDAVFVDLPAPSGWKKKFLPKTSGTPKKNEIIFVSPSGEEMKSKRQLDQYLKSHPGCPSSSEFDWGTGDTPRRSERISKRAKAFEIVEEVPKKKGKRSITKGRSVEKKKNLDEKTEEVREETGAMEEKKALDEKTEQVQEETGAMEENKESVDSEMKDAADDKIGKEEPITDETIMKDSAENDNEATKETIMVEATKPVEDVDNNNTNGQEKADEDMKEHIVEQNEAPAIDNDKVEDEKTDLKIEENTHVKKAEDKKLTDAEETIHKEKAEDKKLIDAEETIHEEKAEDKVVTHIEEKTQEEKSEDKVVTHTEEKTQEEKVEDKVVTNTEEKILEEKAKEVISADRDCKEEAKVDQNPHTATMDSPHADAEKADKKPNSSDNPIDSGVHSINRDEVAAQHKASPIQC